MRSKKLTISRKWYKMIFNNGQRKRSRQAKTWTHNINEYWIKYQYGHYISKFQDISRERQKWRSIAQPYRQHT